MLNSKSIIPLEISVSDEAQELYIRWTDDHLSTYVLMGLRRACPCVSCKGGHHLMSQPVDPEYFFRVWKQKIGIASIDQVGNYAIKILWSDGHASGIYKYDYLREICPCSHCLPEYYADEQ